MKSLMFKGLILLVALTISGCCRQTAAPPSVSHQQTTDSIREVIVERIVHVHDSVPVYIPVEIIKTVVPSTDTSKLETSVAKSTAFIDSLGFLHHDLNNKDQAIYAPVDIDVPVSDTTHEEFHNSSQSDTTYINVPAQLTGGQKFLMRCGWVTIGAVLLGLILLAYKLWVKLR